MRVLAALLLFAGTSLASKHPHAKGKSSSSTSTQASTMKSSPVATTMSSVSATSTASSSAKAGNVKIPGCNSTKEWAKDDDFPTVCQLRQMLQNKGAAGLNNTIFLHDMMDVYEAFSFADTLSVYSPKDKSNTMISFNTFDRGSKKSNTVDAFMDKFETTWSENIHDEYQVRKRIDQAVALDCAGTAYVFTDEDIGIAEVAPYENTSMSHFALFTYPALMKNPKIDQVVQVWEKIASWDRWDDSIGSFGCKVIWKKGDKSTYFMYHADQDELETH